MQDRSYYIRISPENVRNDLFPIPFIDNSYLVNGEIDPCCVLPPDPRIVNTTANTFVYSSMTQILSGATNGDSLLSDFNSNKYKHDVQRLNINVSFTNNFILLSIE